MRFRAAIPAIALVLPLVFVGGCSSGTSSPTTSGSSGASGASSVNPSVASKQAAVSLASAMSAASVAPPLGPAIPPASSVAPAVPAADLPTAAGGFGVKPTLTFPKGVNPPNTLQRKILVPGSGAVVAKSDYLVTNYLGQIWGGKVFDSSYARKATSTFQLISAAEAGNGSSGVISGWVTALAGLKVGTRVMLSLPPSDGYGSAGQPAAGIKGSDTLVFVIDIVGVIASGEGGQTNATPQPAPKNAPTVVGALGKEPTVTIPTGLAAPTAAATYVLAKGTGAPIKSGQTVLAQFVIVAWDGSQKASSWPGSKLNDTSTGTPPPNGLQQLQISTDPPLSGLVGVPLGSRVLVTIPGQAQDPSTGQADPAQAAAIDLVAVYAS